QGVRFVPITFTPTSSNYKWQACGGVNIVLTDRNFLDAAELGLEVASALKKLYPADYKTDKLVLLLGNQALTDELVSGMDPRRVAQEAEEQIEKFQEVRKKYLLY
ncbi:MAG TPA: hypothetical protein VFP40_17410, partial [Terriglobales bacterium]|nr:hypothetical protein [Terriglobales bacterium]